MVIKKRMDGGRELFSGSKWRRGFEEILERERNGMEYFEKLKTVAELWCHFLLMEKDSTYYFVILF